MIHSILSHCRTLALTCTAALVLSACTTSYSDTIPMKPEPYRLGAGDVLRLNVFEQEDMSGEFRVDDNGELSLPLIERIPATGLTVAELESSIRNALQPDYMADPRISVQVINYRDVYVLGEVRNPGNYPYVPNMTVLQAAAIAGGYTYRADESEAEVLRQEGDNLKIRNVPATSQVKPGDTVMIGRRLF